MSMKKQSWQAQNLSLKLTLIVMNKTVNLEFANENFLNPGCFVLYCIDIYLFN